MSIYQKKEDKAFNSSGTTIRFYANYFTCQKTYSKLSSDFAPTSSQYFKEQLSTHLKITFRL